MTEDQLYELSEGDTVRFKSILRPGSFRYYRVGLITREAHVYGVPFPAFNVWLESIDPGLEFHSLEVCGEHRDTVQEMQLVTVEEQQ